ALWNGRQVPLLKSNPAIQLVPRSKSVDANALAPKVPCLLNRWASDNGKVEPTDIGGYYERIRPAKANLSGCNTGSNRKVGLPGQHGLVGKCRGHVDGRRLNPLSLEQI